MGDNLRTHMSVAAIDFCRAHSIDLVCLPPNSTDRMQPLDVGVFRSVKSIWRSMLHKYTDDDPANNIMDKQVFPSYLREMLQKLEPAEKLKNAFRKTGIVPLNPEAVLQDIPDRLSTESIASNIDQQLLKKLEQRRFGSKAKKTGGGSRGTKIPAGQSYSGSNQQDNTDSEESDRESRSSSSEDDGDSSEVDLPDLTDDTPADNVPDDQPVAGGSGISGPVPGSLTAVTYEGQLYIAQVVADQKDVERDHVRLSYMQIRGNGFAWPEKPDIWVASREDILLENVNVLPLNNRGHVGLSKADLLAASNKMVVVFSPFIICFLLIFFHFKKLFKEQMRWDQSKSCLGKRFVLSTSLDTVSLKDKRLQPSLGQSKEITPELPYNSQYSFFVLFVCTLTPVSTVPCSLLN